MSNYIQTRREITIWKNAKQAETESVIRINNKDENI